MCGRFGLGLDNRELEAILVGYHVLPTIEWQPRYNIAPTQRILAIINDDRHEISALKWGFVPPWADAPKVPFSNINAKAERVATSPVYRGALRHARAVVPMTHFYEWAKGPRGKTPMLIHTRDQDVFGVAALWSEWRPRDAADEMEPLRSCALITCQANAVLAESVHDRMPVILPRAAWEQWLDPDEHRPNELLPLLQPYPSGGIEMYPISSAVNSVRNEGPELAEPVA